MRSTARVACQIGSHGSASQLHSRLQFALDAHHDVSGLHFPELVGHLVSGSRAGRRRLYRAAHVLRPKDEKHSLLATLWFNIAHFAIRPWPWILVALASLVLFPGLADPETGYVRVMIAYLPASLRGVMLAAFAAAYMSTIATQLNWGASYIVSDFYRRFVRKEASDKHYVDVSQLSHGLSGARLGGRYLLHDLHQRRVEASHRDRRGHRPGVCCCAGSGGGSTRGARFQR